jgi:hypothetical protein
VNQVFGRATSLSVPDCEEAVMKRAITVVLEDKEIIELMRILLDEDAEGALAFLKNHFKGKARDLLEGG